MRLSLSILLISAMTLAGCGGLRDSRANPSNWFGKKNAVEKSVQTKTAEIQPSNPLIPDPTFKKQNARNINSVKKTGIFRRRNKITPYEGTLVGQVTDIDIEPTGKGSIIRITGISDRNGIYDVRVISDNDDKPVDGVLTFSRKALQPINKPSGAVRSRTIHTAQFITNQVLEETKVIRVIGAHNSLTVNQ